MKYIKRFPFLLVALILLLSTFSAPVMAADDLSIGERLREAWLSNSSELSNDDSSLNSYGLSVMSLSGSEIYADNVVYAFGQMFNPPHDKKSFIYHENLPYGLSTGVICFRMGYSVFFIFFDGNTSSALSFGTGSGGGLRIVFVSNSSYFIYRFSLDTGNLQTFRGVKGLKSYSSTEVMDYTTSAVDDFYISISNNIYISTTDNNIDSGLFYYGDGVDSFEPVWYSTSYLTYAEYQSRKLSSTLEGLSEQNDENYNKLSEQQESYAQQAQEQAESIAASQEVAEASRQSEQLSQEQEHHEETGGWFSQLGDRIAGFFESLKNYLLYFQDTKPEHVNPFDDVLADIEEYLQEMFVDGFMFNSEFFDTLVEPVLWLSNGSRLIDNFVLSTPAYGVFVSFCVVFYVVRKVVGR